MAEVKRKAPLEIGVKGTHLAFIENDGEDTATYEADVITTPNIKSLKIAVDGEATKVTASNGVYDVIAAPASVAVTYNVLALDTETQARILGRKFEEVGEYIVSAISEDGRPEAFWFATEVPNSDGTTVFLSFPKLKSSKELEEEYKDMGSGFEEPSKEYEFESMTTGKNTEYYITTSPIKKEHADKLRETWYKTPVQNLADAKVLIEAAIATTP